MSQDNLEIVVKQFEVTNADELAAVMDTWADDVTLVLRDPFTEDAATGKAAVRGWFADWLRQFRSDYLFDIEETHVAGDRVLAVVAHHGHGRYSGVPVEQRSAYVFTLREGKVRRIEVWASEDREAALEALGLRE